MDLQKFTQKSIEALQDAKRMAEDNGIRIVMLTSALPEESQAWLADNNITGLDYLFADATAIETMMRGNPGFMYVKNATVVDKGRKAGELKID